MGDEVKPKFSVLTACYNGRKYIAPCIDSVVRQTYKNWEMIIYDDCSTDGSSNVIRNTIAKYDKYKDNIRLIKTIGHRLYCGSSYHEASQYVSGALVGILDADDQLTNNAIERIVEAYDKNPDIDFIYTQHILCKTNYNMNEVMNGESGISSMPVGSLLESWETRSAHAFSHWRTFRSSMLKYGLFAEKYKCSIDKYMGMVLELYGYGAFLDECLYLYRFHDGQMTGKMRDKRPKVKRKLIKNIRRLKNKCNLEAKPIIKIK